MQRQLSEDELTALSYEQRHILRQCRSTAIFGGGLPGGALALAATYAYSRAVRRVGLGAYFMVGIPGYFFGLTMALGRCVKPKMQQLKEQWEREQQTQQQQQADPPPPEPQQNAPSGAVSDYAGLQQRNRAAHLRASPQMRFGSVNQQQPTDQA